MEPSEAASPEHFDPEELVGLPLLGVRDLGMAVERFLDAELAVFETSLLELRVLSVCAAHPGCTAVEVSRIIPVDPPAISRVVQPLVQRGLLSRRRSRTDRREVRLRVTDQGLTLLAECHQLLEGASDRFLSPLRDAEARTLRRAVETLLAATY